jgi:WD40 repeat protein
MNVIGGLAVNRPRVLINDGQPKFAAFVSDGTEVVTVGAGLFRFSVTDGRLSDTASLSNAPLAFALAPDRGTLAITSQDSVELRQADTLKVLARVEMRGSAEAVSFSPDGTVLAVRDKSRLYLYRAHELDKIVDLNCDEQLWHYDVTFLPDNRLAATSSHGIDILDVSTGTTVTKLSLGDNDMPESKQLFFRAGHLYARSDFFVYEFDLASTRYVRRLRSNFAQKALVLPEKEWLVFGDISGHIVLTHLLTGREYRRLKGHDASVCSLDLDPSGRWLVSVAEERDVRLWDVPLALSDSSEYSVTGEEFRSFDYSNACGIRFENNAPELLTARSGAIDRWSIPEFRLIQTLTIPPGQGSVQFLSPALAFGGLWSYDTPPRFTAFVSDLRSNASSQLFDFPCEYPTFARLNRSKSVVAAFSRDALFLLSFPSGSVVRSTATHLGPIEDSRFCGLEFSPDDRLLYTAGRDGTLNQWSTTTGELLREYKTPQGNIESFCVSPDGTMLAISEKLRVVFFDPQAWKVTGVIPHSSRVHWTSMALTADNSTLAFAATHCKEISLYSVRSCELIRTLKGHTGGVNEVCVSKDGDFLASTSFDDTLKIWKLE